MLPKGQKKKLFTMIVNQSKELSFTFGSIDLLVPYPTPLNPSQIEGQT